MKKLLLSLVSLYPEEFRDHFGDEIRDDIARDYDEARARGLAPAVLAAVSLALDTVRSAIAERAAPSLAPHAVASSPLAPGLEPQIGPPEKNMLEGFLADLKFAARSLRRSPGFAIVSIGTLGLAIGVNAGMFGVLKRVVLDPLPFANPERLFSVGGTAPGSQLPNEFGLGNDFVIQYQENSKLIDGIGSLAGGTSTLRVGERVERVDMAWATPETFTALGTKPAYGRLPVATDENRVSVLTWSGFQGWFGGDTTILGKTYEVSYGQRTIIGVMPPGFKFPNDRTLILNSEPIIVSRITPGQLGGYTFVRAKPGVTAEAMNAEFTALAKRLPERFGGPPRYAKLIEQFRAVVRPLREQILGPVTSNLWILFASVSLVFAIACANVTNLVLVRTEGRHRELAVRQAIGAGRGQLIRLQMAESLVIAVSAAILAVALAWATLPLMVAAAPQGVPRLTGIKLEWSMIAFAAFAAFVSAIACGFLPALRASAPDLLRLREGGRGATRRRHWARDGLVVVQTAMALVLLIGSGLLMQSYRNLSVVKPGYSTKDIFTFQIAPQQQSLRDGADLARFHLAFIDRLKALPGVQSVGIVENVPLDEGTSIAGMEVEGRTPDPAAPNRLNYTFAGPDYFKTMGIRVLKGREYTVDDVTSTFDNAVISKKAADRLWPGDDPIGKRFRFAGDTNAYLTVVGVVDDVVQLSYRNPPDALVYFPLRRANATAYRLMSPGYAVRTARAEVIGPEIRKIVNEIAPEAPMYRQYTMAFLEKRSMQQLSFTMMTVGVVSILALILGAVGLYGVLSYVVAERTREIGVRMALGAERSQVRRMVVGQGLRVVAIGALIGVVGAFAATRGLGSLLYEVKPADLPIFVSMTGLMLVIGMVASYVPGMRASRVDPIESLRGD